MRKGKHLDDVTTMFAYSHANTPLGQSECTYYLSYYFINNADVRKGGDLLKSFEQSNLVNNMCSLMDKLQIVKGAKSNIFTCKLCV